MFFVEANRGFVPIEHGPFNRPQFRLARELRQIHSIERPEPFPAHLGNNKKIFQVKAGLSKKSREVVKETAKATGLFS